MRICFWHTIVFMKKKRILILNLHFDDRHIPVGRKNKLPQGMGAVFLAGAFSKKRCDIRVYSEIYSGPLEDETLLAWPHMVVLTGVTNCLDRMLHITAYVKTKNTMAIVVAGGAPVRAWPLLSSRIFDYACTGDIEQLREVIVDSLGKAYLSQEMIPRLDLAYWIGIHGHVESSRNCNFNCRFCSLTGEKTGYKAYSLDYIEKQLVLIGKKRTVQFIDNNFFGNDPDAFAAKLELIDTHRRKGRFKYWSAMVTGDFFFNEANLDLVKKAGCGALFSGIESFDRELLKHHKKIQNTILPQTEIIKKTLDRGIAFWYGLFMDIYSRPPEELKLELDYIINNPNLSLPGFITLPIPIPGTPYFLECLKKNKFFPLTKLRHLDGKTLCMEPEGSRDKAVAFIEMLNTMKGYRRKIWRHAAFFAARHRRRFNPEMMFYALVPNALITINQLFTAGLLSKETAQTHISTFEKVESTYFPKFPIHSSFKNHFKPTLLTDGHGRINPDLLPDIEQAKKLHNQPQSLETTGRDIMLYN